MAGENPVAASAQQAPVSYDVDMENVDAEEEPANPAAPADKGAEQQGVPVPSNPDGTPMSETEICQAGMAGVLDGDSNKAIEMYDCLDKLCSQSRLAVKPAALLKTALQVHFSEKLDLDWTTVGPKTTAKSGAGHSAAAGDKGAATGNSNGRKSGAAGSNGGGHGNGGNGKGKRAANADAQPAAKKARQSDRLTRWGTTQAEHDRRKRLGLCFYCAEKHRLAQCPDKANGIKGLSSRWGNTPTGSVTFPDA